MCLLRRRERGGGGDRDPVAPHLGSSFRKRTEYEAEKRERRLRKTKQGAGFCRWRVPGVGPRGRFGGQGRGQWGESSHSTGDFRQNCSPSQTLI